MTRHSLRIVIVLGALITLLGGTGIFAVFSDRATGGADSVTSGIRPKAADLRIEATATLIPDPSSGQFALDCDGEQDGVVWDKDDTTTPQFSVADVQPGQDPLVSGPAGTPSGSFICLKNVGSAALTLSASAIDLADLDVACTGDEATVDQTCGEDPNIGGLAQAGELSPLLTVKMDRVNCSDVASAVLPESPVVALSAFSNEAFMAAPLASNAIACIRIQMAYPTPSDESLAQAAQSDQVTWRFAFDGTAN